MIIDIKTLIDLIWSVVWSSLSSFACCTHKEDQIFIDKDITVHSKLLCDWNICATRNFTYLVRGPLRADHHSLKCCSFWNQHHQCPYIWYNSKPFVISRILVWTNSLSWKRRFFSMSNFITAVARVYCVVANRYQKHSSDIFSIKSDTLHRIHKFSIHSINIFRLVRPFLSFKHICHHFCPLYLSRNITLLLLHYLYLAYFYGWPIFAAQINVFSYYHCHFHCDSNPISATEHPFSLNQRFGLKNDFSMFCYCKLHKQAKLLIPLQRVTGDPLNPLRAKFFCGNINIYLHFMSLLHIDLAQVLKFLPQVRPGLIYSTWSISWLLMSWRRKEPGHQQPWYWPR